MEYEGYFSCQPEEDMFYSWVEDMERDPCGWSTTPHTSVEITTDPAEAPTDCEDEWWMRDAHRSIRAKYGCGLECAMELLGYRASCGWWQKDEGGMTECIPAELVLNFLLGFEYSGPIGNMAGTCAHTLPVAAEQSACHHCAGTGKVHGVFLPNSWDCDVCDGKGVV